MHVTEAQVRRVLSDPPKFIQFGFSLMITRLARLYAADSSAGVLKGCTDEINEFLQKYSRIMGDDYAIISKY